MKLGRRTIPSTPRNDARDKPWLRALHEHERKNRLGRGAYRAIMGFVRRVFSSAEANE